MRRINGWIEGITGILLLVMTLLATVQVIFRYWLQIPTPWLEELIRYLMVYMVFLAGGAAVYRQQHLYVDVFENIFTVDRLRYLNMLRDALGLLFSLYFTYLAFQFVMKQLSGGQVSPAMQISMGWPLAALFLGGLIMVINSAYRIWYLSRHVTFPVETAEREQ